MVPILRSPSNCQTRVESISYDSLTRLGSLKCGHCLTLTLDPFSSCLFVFCNRERDRLKILQWDHNGFWLHYRRLERGRFQWPTGNTAVTVGYREFRWLLDGLPLTQKQAHKEVRLRTAI